MVTYMCYNVLCLTSSKSQEFGFVHCFGEWIPPLVDVYLCVSTRESLWVVGSAPCCGAGDGQVSVFNVEPAQEAHGPVGKVFDEVRLVRVWCWWCNRAGIWGRGYKNAISTSSAMSYLLHLHTHVIGKWSALVSSTSSPCSASPSCPATSSSSCNPIFPAVLCNCIANI
jgi:hypothetical protein